MSKVFLRFVRNDGRELSVNDDVWGITDIKGLDKPEITVYTQKAAIGDGDLVTGARVGARTIEIELTARNVALNEVLRRASTSFFTAGRTYDLYVTRYGEPRYARECWLDSLEIPTERQFKRLVARIDLLCPEGYFLSADSFSKNIAEIEGRCGYPYIATETYGRIYGVYTYAGLVYLDNDGDTEAYCQAVFIAKGNVTNPKLLAGGGYVRVIGTMSAGDVLIIDGREKSVTMNDVNISNQLDKDSDFSGIVFSIGTNSVGFTADIGSNVLDVYVYYNKRYMGA
jgi:hypothetical protein